MKCEEEKPRISISRDFAIYSIFCWWLLGLQNCRITKGYKVQISSYDNVKYLVYWLKAEYVHSALEQNTECPQYLPKHNLLSSR